MVPAALGEAAIPAAISLTIFLLIDHLMDEFWGLGDITGDLHIFIASHLAPENHPSSRDWFCKIFFFPDVLFCKTLTHWVGNLQTGEQLYYRSSATGVKILSPKAIFPAWGSGIRRNPRESGFECHQPFIVGSINSTLGSCAHWDPWENSSDLIRVWTRSTY